MLLDLLTVAIVPQLPTAALFYAGWKHQKSWPWLVAPFPAPFVFFLLARAYWSRVARDAYERTGEPACGALGALILITTGVGVLLHFTGALALIITATLQSERR